MTEILAAARPLIALVGRPNVGKSTLFNRIAGRRMAIVEDEPGVTRDRNYADCEWDHRAISVVDTGGFEPGAPAEHAPDRLMRQVREQAQLAVDEAAAVVLVVDGRAGLTEVDRSVAGLLRRAGKRLFVAVNKMDSGGTEAEAPLSDFYELGFGEVFPVSAEHDRGVGELLDAIVAELQVPRTPAPEELTPLDEREEGEEGEEGGRAPDPDAPIRLAIIGRPNVGKSTFVNALLGEQRFVVSAVAGTTRDSIDSEITYKDRKFVVTDTAGIRRKRSIAQKVELYSVVRAMRSIDEAEVVACLLDASEAGVEQDARLLGLVAEKSKVLICVVNKWDLAEAEEATQAWYRKELAKRLPFISFAPMIFTSAKTGKNVAKVLDTAARLVQQSRARFPTPALNDLLENVQRAHPAPLARGKPVKLYYMAQVGYAPPTFAIQCNRPEAISGDYKRFLENRMREAFGLEVPIRFLFKERRRARRRGKPSA
ncbi:ribosome biogenesis GTPase Der [Anaeromyxobacter paludicola]|uniref:GTPase Der n=1 Tax=Anaeromyxobacter paludicola TaxID=2918171 RepID=A0ABN6N6X3_9BACT|nr:ribosome biogenesis GTPase Der [Anaeromyxobacter paludicola]BDG07588.1 GTPase Der [Anaeromyxobacter paludicola]